MEVICNKPTILFSPLHVEYLSENHWKNTLLLCIVMVCTKIFFFMYVPICPPFDNHRNYYVKLAFQTSRMLFFICSSLIWALFYYEQPFLVSVSLPFQHVNCYVVQLLLAFDFIFFCCFL